MAISASLSVIADDLRSNSYGLLKRCSKYCKVSCIVLSPLTLPYTMAAAPDAKGARLMDLRLALPNLGPLRNLLIVDDIARSIFELLAPREALLLMRSVWIWRPDHYFSGCINTCESSEPFAPIPPAPHADFILRVTGNWNLVNPNFTCGRRAVYHENASGRMRSSFCELPHNDPGNAFASNRSHHRFDNSTVTGAAVRRCEPLVCLPCKQARRQDWDWRGKQ